MVVHTVYPCLIDMLSDITGSDLASVELASHSVIAVTDSLNILLTFPSVARGLPPHHYFHTRPDQPYFIVDMCVLTFDPTLMTFTLTS